MKLKPIIKKNGFEDTFFVMVVLIGVVFFVIIAAKAWGEMKQPLDDGLSSALPSDTPVNISRTLGQTTSTLTMFDKLIPFLLIGLFGFVLIGASLYMQHPIGIFIGVIVIAVAILVGTIYANTYHQIADSTQFASTTDDFPISDAFMKFLPYIIFLMFIGVTAAIIWSRKSGGGGL